jgi:hypothetical protein
MYLFVRIYCLIKTCQNVIQDEVEMDGRVVERKGRMTANMEVSDFFL